MRHALGFFIPAVTTVAAANTFAEQLALACVAGLFGVVGVTLAAYVTSRRAETRRTEVLKRRLKPRKGERRNHEDE